MKKGVKDMKKKYKDFSETEEEGLKIFFFFFSFLFFLNNL